MKMAAVEAEDQQRRVFIKATAASKRVSEARKASHPGMIYEALPVRNCDRRKVISKFNNSAFAADISLSLAHQHKLKMLPVCSCSTALV